MGVGGAPTPPRLLVSRSLAAICYPGTAEGKPHGSRTRLRALACGMSPRSRWGYQCVRLARLPHAAALHRPHHHRWACFAGFHSPPDVITMAVRWSLRGLGDRQRQALARGDIAHPQQAATWRLGGIEVGRCAAQVSATGRRCS